jgi:uncharacterized protein YeaC (DUF1315 family)
MSTDLLREYISTIVEKIRSTKYDDNFGHKFNFKEFKSLENIKQMIMYADSFLEKLGQGSSRAAYLLSSRYVLKIAINQKGIAQNETEVDVYTNPKSRPIVSKIHSEDPEYKWLVADVVKPITSEKEFKNITGIEFDYFIRKLRPLVSGTSSEELPEEFIQAAVATIRANQLLMADIEVLEHWGKTPDGRAVLLDYGFTREVWKNHYKEDKHDVKPLIDQLNELLKNKRISELQLKLLHALNVGGWGDGKNTKDEDEAAQFVVLYLEQLNKLFDSVDAKQQQVWQSIKVHVEKLIGIDLTSASLNDLAVASTSKASSTGSSEFHIGDTKLAV